MKVGKWRGIRSFEGGVENWRDHEKKEKKEVENTRKLRIV